MIKFAKSKYSGFENSTLGLKLRNGDVFAVTSEIEKSEVYQMGVATRNFVPAQVRNPVELSKVVNLTDTIKAEFMASLKPKEEEVPVVEEVRITVNGVELEDDETVDVPETETEPTIAFTELAGNVGKAVEAISKEKDIKKLNDALLLDERKTVKKAVLKRIEELES